MNDLLETRICRCPSDEIDHRSLTGNTESPASLILVWVFAVMLGCIPCFGQLEQSDETNQVVDSGSGAVDDDFGTEDDDFGTAKTNSAIDTTIPKEIIPKSYKSPVEAHLTFLKALESEDRFPSAATCSECHPDHYREWSVSAHAYAQISPVFNTMQAAIVDLTSGTNGDFCIRCHTQVGMQRSEPLFTSNLKRHPASIEGITCVVCHRVGKNYGKISGRSHINQGDIFSAIYGPGGDAIMRETLEVDSLKNKLNIQIVDEETGERLSGKKDLHATIVKFDPIARSGFCGACHDVNLLDGFRLEEAFSQYKKSPAARKEHSCQDCHMGKVPGAVSTTINKVNDETGFNRENYAIGPGARIGGDIWAKEGVEESGTWGFATRSRKRTNHMFAGPDFSIVHPGIFPHSKNLRETMWQYERVDPASGKFERSGLRHFIAFRYQDGWGNPESPFEIAMIDAPEREQALPWPWNDPIARETMLSELNNNFRLLNEIQTQRIQILRRGVQLHGLQVSRDDRRGLGFRIEVVNGTDGHGVPTGFDAERLAFLHVTVTDSKGRIIFESGDRDPNGDVRDLHSAYVHAHTKKSNSHLAATEWKSEAGLKRLKEDQYWLVDPFLFNLQSKFLTRNHRGGESEQILAVNNSLDPLPYIRPDPRPAILVARPFGVRKQARILQPNGHRWADYRIKKAALTGSRPYTVNAKFIYQMVPVNLIKKISSHGFDYNLSPREISKRIVLGHPMTPEEEDEHRRGGALTLWDKTVELPVEPSPRFSTDWTPTEAEIMAPPFGPFPYRELSGLKGLEIIKPTSEAKDEKALGPKGNLDVDDGFID